MKRLWLLATLIFIAAPIQARIMVYALTVAREKVEIVGKAADKITINGTIPGPILRFVEGDDAVIHVTNAMREETSVHWHGLLLPDGMDGVPGLGGFPGIKPGETFTYRFRVRQSGTYWYHAHSALQEQEGHYGAIVIAPKQGEAASADRDYVLVLSDFSLEKAEDVMAHLKMSSEYYQYARPTVKDFFSKAAHKGARSAWQDAKAWGAMRMLPSDLSDVGGYAFLVNGKTPIQNWTGLFEAGQRVRLRFVNASAMSFFDVRIPGLEMTVVAADGQAVAPVVVDEFRCGPAETYDVVVSPRDERAYTVVAEPIDRTGFALATLAPRKGMKGPAPAQRPRASLTMADMGMAHEGHAMDHAQMHGIHPGHGAGHAAPNDHGSGSGWRRTGAPHGAKTLSYADLRSLASRDTHPPEREIEIRLGGNMERYIWTMNGKKYSEAGPFRLRYGERVRLKFVNETMMAHPMHLHGMFVQLENGQPADRLPSKHTVIVAPGASYSALLTANEPGEWAFHCHLLYHMAAGMMNKVVVGKLQPAEEMQSNAAARDEHEALEQQGGARAHSHRSTGVAHPIADPHAKTHGGQAFHAFRLEMGAKVYAGDKTWDFDGWSGTDENKLWLKSEGSHAGGGIVEAEASAMYSRKISDYWDAQIGLRHSFEPHARTALAVGFEGLAPYFFETSAHLYLGEGGDIGARLRQENDLLLTQRWILQPFLEANLRFRGLPEVKAGLTEAGLGLQLRYEIARKIAPYAELKREWRPGPQQHGESGAGTLFYVGLRFMF